MNLTVLKWLWDTIVPFLGRTIELIFRIMLCLLPLGVYMILLQKRSKASAVSSLSTYTNDRSRWQHIFPGFILISINPDDLTNYLNQKKGQFQTWVNTNKYILSFIFMFLIVALMVMSYIRGGY